MLPFEFRRVQFPVSLCFAMTINKSQEQTFKAVGVDMTDESFTHGMFYVALSRVGSSDCLTLSVIEDCKTRNVVYSEVFVYYPSTTHCELEAVPCTAPSKSP